VSGTLQAALNSLLPNELAGQPSSVSGTLKAFVTGAEYIFLPVLMLQITSPTFEEEVVYPVVLTFNYLNGDLGLCTVTVMMSTQDGSGLWQVASQRLYTAATSGTIAIPLTLASAPYLPEGQYVLTLTMLYDNGDTATQSVTVTVVPVSEDIPIPAIAIVQSGTTLVVTVSATDIAGLASAGLTLDGVDIQDWVIT
jgi:hypothetical protein